MRSVSVQLEGSYKNSYEVQIGRDILDTLALRAMGSSWGSRYIVITDPFVSPLHCHKVLKAFNNLGLNTEVIEISRNNSSKDIDAALGVIRTLLVLGADRSSCLMALGGGSVGDLTGFVASIYMRGIPYVQIPTTLLAQVDSSIGGKTGLDLEEGKNLIGTFYQPRGVFSDLAFLETLSPLQIRDGIAEVVKYGLIEEPELLSYLESHLDLIKKTDPQVMEEIVFRCCNIKKRFVEMDEKDLGVRRILNFGHTVGHALEAESRYELSHGQAISVGMLSEARISWRLGHLPLAELERIEALLASFELPVRIPQGVSVQGILMRLEKDKKRLGKDLPFVLLRRSGLPFMETNIPRKLVEEVLEELRA